MKNKFLKAIYGVMLSALLVITMAIPSLADCATHTLINGNVKKTYINASENSHQIQEETSGTCTVCNQPVIVINIYSEPHTPDANGKCTACRYQVWHRP